MRANRRTVIVTGAGGGIGAAAVRILSADGWLAVAADKDTQKLEQQDFAREVIRLRMDVTCEADWQNAVACAQRAGRLTGLVNNAGVSTGDQITECTLDYWHEIMDINTTGPFLGMKTAIPIMRENGGGAIVNVSSVGGLLGIGGGTVYPASKGALRSLSKRVAMTCGADGIRVNTVYPGWIETPMTAGAREAKRQQFLCRQALPIAGMPEDVANAIAFLLSEKARFITGADLMVDGGFSAT